MAYKNPPKEHQFKKGNPGGSAPKGKRISTWMLELGQMEKLPDPSTLPINGQIALARIKKALKENGVHDAEVILERTEGKVESTVNLKTPSVIDGKTPAQQYDALKNVLENLKPKE